MSDNIDSILISRRLSVPLTTFNSPSKRYFSERAFINLPDSSSTLRSSLKKSPISKVGGPCDSLCYFDSVLAISAKSSDN